MACRLEYKETPEVKLKFHNVRASLDRRAKASIRSLKKFSTDINKSVNETVANFGRTTRGIHSEMYTVRCEEKLNSLLNDENQADFIFEVSSHQFRNRIDLKIKRLAKLYIAKSIISGQILAEFARLAGPNVEIGAFFVGATVYLLIKIRKVVYTFKYSPGSANGLVAI